MGSGGRVLLPGYTPGGGNRDTEIPGGGGLDPPGLAFPGGWSATPRLTAPPLTPFPGPADPTFRPAKNRFGSIRY